MTAPSLHPRSPIAPVSNPLIESGCKPLLKWPGGKTKLLGDLIARMPSSFRHYLEPFVGGGALFWRLFGANAQTARATIADINMDLMSAYIAIAVDPFEVDVELDAFRNAPFGGNDAATYYGARDAWNELRGAWSSAKRAATMLYLNHACFNGLWRVNASGGFNVPIGKNKTIKLASRGELSAASLVLKRTDIHCAPFEETIEAAGDGDFVYCDSPYMTRETAAGASFTNYTASGFGEASHRLLARAACHAIRRGARVMISQADAPLAREIYTRPYFRIDAVEAPRSINARGSGRGNVGELIICGGY